MHVCTYIHTYVCTVCLAQSVRARLTVFPCSFIGPLFAAGKKEWRWKSHGKVPTSDHRTRMSHKTEASNIQNLLQIQPYYGSVARRAHTFPIAGRQPFFLSLQPCMHFKLFVNKVVLLSQTIVFLWTDSLPNGFTYRQISILICVEDSIKMYIYACMYILG